MRLTDITIRSLQPPPRGARIYTDDIVPGFGVRVSEGGTKSFVLTHGPRHQRETIGRVGIVGLQEARTDAKRRLAEYTLGKNRPKAKSWDAAKEEYLVEKADKLKPRTLADYTDARQMRADIPISLPTAFAEEARKLRNRLLHYRFCHLFETKLDTDMALTGVEPRVNQIALPLLSLVDDPGVRAEIGDLLKRNQSERIEQRQSTTEARVVAVLTARTATDNGFPVTIGAITAAFNTDYATEYGKTVSDRWIGHRPRRLCRVVARSSEARHQGDLYRGEQGTGGRRVPYAPCRGERRSIRNADRSLL